MAKSLKIVRHTSANTQTKLDRISRLPDDILVNIISRLTVMEAARTSVLSCRWKTLWTCSTSLNFDASEKLFYAYESPRKLQVERYKYMVWVNKVLDLIQDSNINEFRVRFDLTDYHKSVINYWIFAAILEKRVAKFELNLRPDRGSGYYLDQYKLLQEYFDKFKSAPHCLTSLESLRCLCLEGVNISQEILEFFIHNCPFLEQLRVAYSSNFSRLEVVGSLLPLKYLDC